MEFINTLSFHLKLMNRNEKKNQTCDKQVSDILKWPIIHSDFTEPDAIDTIDQ